jgi:hypothetical protein
MVFPRHVAIAVAYSNGVQLIDPAGFLSSATSRPSNPMRAILATFRLLWSLGLLQRRGSSFKEGEKLSPMSTISLVSNLTPEHYFRIQLCAV